jgi:lactate racemase
MSEYTDCVVHTERHSPPRVIQAGESLLFERLPVGSRVIFPKQPLPGLRNPGAAIRYALNHPEGMPPLYTQLKPGMRVTIAVDDISVPLPPMRTPDLRQQVLEIVLGLLADHGVEDIHIIVATSFHRRMTEAEMARMVGQKIFGEFHPKRLYNHDAEDPDGMVALGETRHGEAVTINRRAAESDLVIYVNVNLVPMDGGHKSVGVGLCGYETLQAHHNPETIRQSNSYMDPNASAIHRSCNRIGRIIDEKLKVFHIETAVNNHMYSGPLEFLGKREEDYTRFDWMKAEAMRFTLDKTPWPLRRKIFQAVPAPFELIAVAAGKTEPVHDKILDACFRQYAVPVEGQADVLILPIPYLSPYNVNSSVLNPILVQVMALGYLFNFYRGKPLLKKGGTIIALHPCHDEFDSVHHPSYVEFFNRLLPQSRDSDFLQKHFEAEFAHNPQYRQMYRHGNAYHGVHPFYMWYWGEGGRQHAGRIIAAGAVNEHVPARLGFERSRNLTEALAMASDTHGPGAEITLLHVPPILIADMAT